MSSTAPASSSLLFSSLSMGFSLAALDAAQADVGAVGLAVEVDLLAGGVGEVAGLLEGRRHGGDVEHAAAVGEHAALVVELGARMVDGHAVHGAGVLDAADDLALLVGAGVAGGGQHDRDGPVVAPADVLGVEGAVVAGEEDVDEVGLHARQHDLGLGVAEAGVELEDLRAVLGEHEAAVEAAGVGDALGGELGDDALLDVDHGLELLVGDHGHRAVDAHAARVGAEVAVEGALVVLRGGQGHKGLAVGEGQKRAPYPHLQPLLSRQQSVL